jgi:hypothetical protein
MATVDEDNDDICFVQTDPACQSDIEIKDLDIGDYFIFRGERYRKHSDQGWYLGICNVVDDFGRWGHIHPTTKITLVQ